MLSHDKVITKNGVFVCKNCGKAAIYLDENNYKLYKKNLKNNDNYLNIGKCELNEFEVFFDENIGVNKIYKNFPVVLGKENYQCFCCGNTDLFSYKCLGLGREWGFYYDDLPNVTLDNSCILDDYKIIFGKLFYEIEFPNKIEFIDESKDECEECWDTLEIFCRNIEKNFSVNELIQFDMISDDIFEYYENDIETKKINSLLRKCKNVPVDALLLKKEFSDKDAVLHLMNIEKNIRFIIKRLTYLYKKQYIMKMSVDRERLALSQTKRVELEEVGNKIETLSADLNKTEQEIAKTFGLKVPIRPIFNLTKPSEPTYKAPSLFNKKKVAEENRLLKNVYEKRIEEYDKEKADYDIQLELYRAKLFEYETTLARKKEEYFNDIRQKLVLLEEEKMVVMQKNDTPSIEELEKNNEFYTKNTALNLCNQEIAECEKMMVELFKTKKQFENAEIVYSKYIDFVALTTIYEYFASGRVDSLKGANGAYNLYESELKSKIIIGKLDKIISQLEEIKTNQYNTYKILSEINDNITYISEKMECAIDSLKSIDSNTKDIAETNEIIAYNTTKTAQYSKINAELTNALGFMVALKG